MYPRQGQSDPMFGLQDLPICWLEMPLSVAAEMITEHDQMISIEFRRRDIYGLKGLDGPPEFERAFARGMVAYAYREDPFGIMRRDAWGRRIQADDEVKSRAAEPADEDDELDSVETPEEVSA